MNYLANTKISFFRSTGLTTFSGYKIGYATEEFGNGGGGSIGNGGGGTIGNGGGGTIGNEIIDDNDDAVIISTTSRKRSGYGQPWRYRERSYPIF